MTAKNRKNPNLFPGVPRGVTRGETEDNQDDMGTAKNIDEESQPSLEEVTFVENHGPLIEENLEREEVRLDTW